MILVMLSSLVREPNKQLITFSSDWYKTSLKDWMITLHQRYFSPEPSHYFRVYITCDIVHLRMFGWGKCRYESFHNTTLYHPLNIYNYTHHLSIIPHPHLFELRERVNAYLVNDLCEIRFNRRGDKLEDEFSHCTVFKMIDTFRDKWSSHEKVDTL